MARRKGAAAPRYQPPNPPPAPERSVKLELSTKQATSGKHSLKLAYAGDKLPTVGTRAISVPDWSGYKTLQADVTASRTCVAVFRVMREKGERGDGWEGMASRCEKVAHLEACQNEVADLASIPARSLILRAWFLVVKPHSPDPAMLRTSFAMRSPLKPAFFVAEACHRDWDEPVANGIEYTEGRFWREIWGGYWRGDGPDFLPLVIAYDQARHDQNESDFTEAIRFWTSGRHPNYGFTMHRFGDYMEHCRVWGRHVPEIQKRPALVIIYEPPE